MPRSTPTRSPPTAGSAPATSAPLDAAGYLRITGRLKEIVIRKGEKFSVTRDRGRSSRAIPAVAEAAVRRAARRAERRARLRRRDPAPRRRLTLADLAAFLRSAGLARQKLPEQLEIVDALPRTDSGKIHRAALRGRFS